MTCVFGLEAARAALRAGETQLTSPPYAACHSGVNYYRAMLQQLRTEFPAADFEFTLCCGDNPAIAHDALRLGFEKVVCDCSAGMLQQLNAIAKPLGATVTGF